MKGKTVNVAVYLYPPFSMKDDAGNYHGFDIDILKAIAENQQFSIVFQECNPNEIFSAIQQGQYDTSTSVTITPEREERLSFSWPIDEIGLGIVVNEHDHSTKGVSDLSGKVIGTFFGTGENLCQKLKSEGKIKDFHVSNNNVGQVYQNLAKGEIDAIINDLPANYFYQRQLNGKIRCLDQRLTYDYSGFPLRKGNDDLRIALNNGLKKIMNSGLYSKFYYKYVKNKPFVTAK